MSLDRSRRSFLATGVAAVTTAKKNDAAAKPTTTSQPGPSDSDLRTRISRADLVYRQPVVRSEEGLPIGNGLTGTLVWTTPTQIRMQVNRVDVYANNSYTNSFVERHNDYCGGCGYVEIDLGGASGSPFVEPSFRARLGVYDGLLELSGNQTEVELLASCDEDVIVAHVRKLDPQTSFVRIHLRMLRYETKYFGAELEALAKEHAVVVETRNHTATSKLEIEQGCIVLTQEFREGNYYNKSAVAIRFAGLSGSAEIVNEQEIQLSAKTDGRPLTILVASASSFDPSTDPAAMALRQLDRVSRKPYSALRSETGNWWHHYWAAGSVQLQSSDGTAAFLESNYHYFLYLMAATSRGKFPPKFNGMLWNTGGDLRTWGAQHWFANASCYYEALFTANRLDLLNPFFDMYSGMFEACATAAHQQWGSGGIYIPETSYFDGLEKLPDSVADEMRELYLLRKPWAERSAAFRTYAETKHPHSSRWNWIASGKWQEGRWNITERGSGPYGNVSHIFATTAKVAYLFWRRYEFTQDRAWLSQRAYPMLRGAAEFYRNHPNVQKEADGKHHIHHANSNESVWGARDTDEDLAAMRGLFSALLRASELLETDTRMRPVWQRFLQDLTPLPSSADADALRPVDYHGPQVFARGRYPVVKAGSGILPDQNSMPHWFFDLCNAGSKDEQTTQLANRTLDAYFNRTIDSTIPVGVLSKLPIAAATLGRTEAITHLIPNQIRAIRPERSTSYQNGGVLRNRMTLREGPQALDAQRLGRAAEALHLALLQSAPPEPGSDPVIRLFTAWPKDWNASFQLLGRGGFVIESTFENGSVQRLQIRSLAGAPCRLQNPWPRASVHLIRNGVRSESLQGETLLFPTTKGELLMVIPS